MCGYTRLQVLELRHWEVAAVIEGYYKLQAQEVLSMSEAVALGSGTISDDHARKELTERLAVRAGYQKPKPKLPENVPWTMNLVAFGGGSK